MIRIGLVGFGVVNSGVYEILTSRREYLRLLAGDDIAIVKILIRDRSKPRDHAVPAELFTDDVNEFFAEPLDIIAEAITNTDAAHVIITTALERGIDVVSASKAVISKYYDELFQLAEINECGLYVEAAVAGGVPIIKPMLQTLQTNTITNIKAILNGTTNFILSKMYNDNQSFEEALSLAQQLGYAEADPTDDVEGYDALRKLVILSSLAYRTRLKEEDIPCRGITSITKEDIAHIRDLDLIVKLIGTSVLSEDGISASIEPVLFRKDSVFHTVQLSNNIVSVTGDNVGELQFFGQGAGKLPTANSIVSDIIDILSGVSPIRIGKAQSIPLRSNELLRGMYYIRFDLDTLHETDILDTFRRADIAFDVIHRTNQLVLLTETVDAHTMETTMASFPSGRRNHIRIAEGALRHEFATHDKPLIVQKFGGTSLATPDKIKAVASKLIETRKAGYDVIAVVSAMGRQTDDLIDVATQVSTSPRKREMDMLLATGEQISISLLSMAIHDRNERAIALTTMQSGILTDEFHNNASIIKVNTKRLKQELTTHGIVVIPGFQGLTKNQDVTTLGRGGSDTTAVALSAVMNAVKCEIYTDVKGVYTADPRIVPDARRWSDISYNEMLELASLGAQVMHPRSVELAKKYQVPLVIRSTFDDDPGTVVKEAEMIEKVLVRGVTSDRDIVKVSIAEVPDMPGIAYHLFELLAAEKVAIDTIIQSVGRENINDISFTVHQRDLDATVKACETYVKTISTGRVITDDNVIKLSIVGIGMAGGSKVASTFFKALYESGINIQMISTSEIKISCIIEDKDIDDAIRRIHQYFQLGEEVNIET